jgi:hypothetical protein
MFVVELQRSRLIQAETPEEATKTFRNFLKKLDEDTSYYDVYNTFSTERFVIAHNVDEGPPEFERVEYLTAEERVKLVEEMIFKAHCDDSTLRQICEMAAMQINTQDAYKDWVGEDDEASDSGADQTA